MNFQIPNKLKYIPNNKLKRKVTSSSPSMKNTKIENNNPNYRTSNMSLHHKNNSLNKSQDIKNLNLNNNIKKPSLHHFIHFKNNYSIEKKIIEKKKINNDSSLNKNHSFSINHNVKTSNIGLINKSNKLKYKSQINVKNNAIKIPKKILTVNVNNDISFSRNSTSPNYLITDINDKKNKENIRQNFLVQHVHNNTSLINYSTFSNNFHQKTENLNTESIINERDNILNNLLEIEKKINFNNFNDKNKKNNNLKFILEEFIKIFPEKNKNFFNNILNEYNDLISLFINDGNHLIEENEREKIKNSNLEKENNSLKKMLFEKEKEIELLKIQKINNNEQIFSNSTNASYGNNSTKENQQKQYISNNEILYNNNNNKTDKNNNNNNNNNTIVEDERYKYVKELNKKNLNDLDTLYFFDKIHMNNEVNKVNQQNELTPYINNKGEVVPLLNLNFEERRKSGKNIKKKQVKKEESLIQKLAKNFNLK